MYALADASGATAMTRIIGWVGPRAKKSPRGQPGRRRQGHVKHLVCDLLTDCGGSVASPRCSLTVVASPPFFVSSLDAALPLLILRHARKKIFVSNITDKKNIVSDNCHKLRFYFLHV
jgi:hypothetical protein